jgi:NADH-quinone oxidoreductase subunit N
MILVFGSLLFAVLSAAMESRKRVSIIVAAAGAALLGIFALWAPIDTPFTILGLTLKTSGTWSILGRTLVLGESTRAAVSFLYLAGAFIFAGSIIADAGRHFHVLGLSCLMVLAASLMIQPFLYAAILLEMAAMGGVLILAPPEASGRRGALRLLAIYTLAMMVILYTGWLLETEGVTSGTPELAREATYLLALGFAMLLGVPPFHLWLPTAGDEANPFGLSFVSVVLQSAGLLFLLHFLDAYQWLRESAILHEGIRLAGIIMAVLGGMWTMAQRSIGKLMAYAILADLGITLLAVGAGGPEGYQLALGLTGLRIIGLALWALGLVMARRGEQRLSLKAVEGRAYRSPWAVAAAVVGLLSIGGFPLTAGFPGRWGLLVLLGGTDPLAAGSILLASFAIGSAAIRWLKISLRPTPPLQRSQLSNEEGFFLIGGIVLCVLLGAFPQLIFPWVVRAAQGLSNLVP